MIVIACRQGGTRVDPSWAPERDPVLAASGARLGTRIVRVTLTIAHRANIC